MNVVWYMCDSIQYLNEGTIHCQTVDIVCVPVVSAHNGY